MRLSLMLSALLLIVESADAADVLTSRNTHGRISVNTAESAHTPARLNAGEGILTNSARGRQCSNRKTFS